MAMTLIGLLAFLGTNRKVFLLAAMVLLLIDMIWPRFYVPVAKLWLGLSAALGAVMTRIIVTVIFVSVVTPIALMLKAFGKDSLQMKQWKAGRESVFTERNHTYSNEDIRRPY